MKNDHLNLYGTEEVELNPQFKTKENHKKTEGDMHNYEKKVNLSANAEKGVLNLKHIKVNGSIKNQNNTDKPIYNLTSYTIDKDKDKNTIKIISKSDYSKEFKVEPKEAPDLQLATKQVDKLGIDDYDSYEDKESGVDYSKHYEVDENNGRIPRIIYTSLTKEDGTKFSLEFQTSDKSTINGLCKYNFDYSTESMTITPQTISNDNKLTVDIDINKVSEGDSYLTITDDLGNFKDKIKFVDKRKNKKKEYDFQIIKLAYKENDGTIHIANNVNSTYLNHAYHQLNIKWQLDNIITVQIDETEIESITRSDNTYSKERIIGLLKNGGKDSTDAEDYDEILQYYFENKVKDSDGYKGEKYHVVVTPSSIGYGKTGFAVGQNQCYITPPSNNTYKYALSHELGHNLTFNHIWDDLGTTKEAIDNNNIMGYDGGNSFWIWQKYNISDKN